MKKYKALIFDMDGTLLDTLSGIISAINKTFKDFNHDVCFSNDDGKYFIGAGAAEFARRALARANINDIDFMQFRNSFLYHYEIDQKVGTKPFEGLSTLLTLLKENGYIIGICSNKPQDLLNKVTEQIYPEIKFDLIVGQRPGVPCKPEKDMFDIVKNELKLSDAEILYVGDSEYDFKFAKNSNVDCCICTYGYGLYDNPFMNEVQYKVATVDELKEFLLGNC